MKKIIINWNAPMIKFAEGAILAGGAAAYPVLYHLHHGMTCGEQPALSALRLSVVPQSGSSSTQARQCLNL
jgi:hypothetical protein